MKKALITGITGQDGSYLTELLIEKGYEVHGIKRRASQLNTHRIDHLYQEQHIENRKLILHYGDLTDSSNLIRIIQTVQPDEIYNLAAQSHVAVSFESPEYTADTNAIGTVRLLEAVRILGLIDRCRFYQASTSELFGKAQEPTQNEKTPFYPRSPYAVAKLYAYWIVINYREAYKMYACNGILFNHESPRRGETFVTRKITRALAQIRLGRKSCLYLGNLDAKRDWGHAKDYVEMQWLMLQEPEPDDYVISTGVHHSVREFIETAANELGIILKWEGNGVEEQGVVESITDIDCLHSINQQNQVSKNSDKILKTGDVIIKIDPRYYRPTEVESLLGDSTKAKNKLGWSPRISFKELVTQMIHSDLNEAQRDTLCSNEGFNVLNCYE